MIVFKFQVPTLESHEFFRWCWFFLSIETVIMSSPHVKLIYFQSTKSSQAQKHAFNFFVTSVCVTVTQTVSCKVDFFTFWGVQLLDSYFFLKFHNVIKMIKYCEHNFVLTLLYREDRVSLVIFLFQMADFLLQRFNN